MAVRTACAALRGRVRTLLGVESDDALLPSEEEQQYILDQHMEVVEEERLCVVRTLAPDAYVEWHVQRRGGFDTAAKLLDLNDNRTVLVDGDFETDGQDPITGNWRIDSTLAATTPWLAITGRRYDVHGAAADLGESLITAMRVQGVDVSDGDASIKRNQQIKTMEAAIARLRQRQWMRSSPGSRSDAASMYR